MPDLSFGWGRGRALVRWQVPSTKSDRLRVQVWELISPKKNWGLRLSTNHLPQILAK